MQESFEKYRIEDGHFLLYDEVKDAQIDEMERTGVKIYPDYYLEEPCAHDGESENDSTLRIYKVRQEINKVCLMDGKMPEGSGEIALDRMYADNNRIQTGDIIKCGNVLWKLQSADLSDGLERRGICADDARAVVYHVADKSCFADAQAFVIAAAVYPA